MSNDQDDAVPWYQGIELFVGMKRLGKEVYLDYDSDTKTKTRADSKRHAGWKNRQRKGITEQDRKLVKQEAKRRYAEAKQEAVRRGVDPSIVDEHQSKYMPKLCDAHNSDAWATATSNYEASLGAIKNEGNRLEGITHAKKKETVNAVKE